MTYLEALEWLRGNRSTINTVPSLPLETWQERIANTDLAMVQQAYWIVKAHEELNAALSIRGVQ